MQKLNAGKDVGKSNLYTLLVGMQISSVTMEVRMEVPQKTKNNSIYTR
jgi:hypothetical protein